MGHTRVGVVGAGGRVGKLICERILGTPDLILAALVESPGNAVLGKEQHGLIVTDNMATVLSKVDVFIDFTSPSACVGHVEVSANGNVPFVIGTTGVDVAGQKKIAEAARRVPIVFSPNMSLSANVLFDVVQKVAGLLPSYDAEVVEIHHNLKKDAPSGTAQRLAESVQRGRNAGRFVYGRQGLVGERNKEEIGVHAVRGGDVVGDHTVLFLGNGERIELVHRVTSRAAFAAGAVASAKWVIGKPAGLYDMGHVLGLK